MWVGSLLTPIWDVCTVDIFVWIDQANWTARNPPLQLYIATVEALTSELLIKTPTIINGDMVNKVNGDKSPILQIKKIDSYLTQDCAIDYKGNLECQAQK